MMPEQPVAESLVGTVLEGAYRIDRLLSEGGMGAVFEATQLRLNKRLAVKVIRSGLPANSEAVARFHREAMVTSGLGHPHIVQVIDFSSTPAGNPFLVMEFLEGEDLEHRLGRVGSLPPVAALHIVKQIAAALAAAHGKGIVHRDLKPANICLVEAAGTSDFVKVLDFGISKVHAATTKLTKVDMVMGSVNYMPPEQALGRVDEIDDRADQWALACVAWECLAGRGPFIGDNAQAVLYQVVHESPPPLAVAGLGRPRGIEAVLLRALAKNKDKRFASVAEFVDALERAVGETVAALPAPPEQAGGQAIARTARLPDNVLALPPPRAEGRPAPAAGSPPQPRERLAQAAPVRTEKLPDGPAMPARPPAHPARPPMPATERLPPPESGGHEPVISARRSPPSTFVAASGGLELDPAEPRPRSRTRYVALAAVLLALLGGGAAYFFVSRAGNLQIAVAPADARLSVDGVAIAGEPPYTIARRPGVYRLAVARPGYVTREDRVQISAGQQGHVEIDLEPSADSGFDLTSEPSGGLVWLDDKPLVADDRGKQATTRFHASRIAPGPHMVEIRGNPQLRDWRQEFYQEPGQTMRLHAVLEPAAAAGKAAAASKSQPSPEAASPEAAAAVRASVGDLSKQVGKTRKHVSLLRRMFGNAGNREETRVQPAAPVPSPGTKPARPADWAAILAFCKRFLTVGIDRGFECAVGSAARDLDEGEQSKVEALRRDAHNQVAQECERLVPKEPITYDGEAADLCLRSMARLDCSAFSEKKEGKVAFPAPCEKWLKAFSAAASTAKPAVSEEPPKAPAPAPKAVPAAPAKKGPKKTSTWVDPFAN
jgi:eukaryotic-like serine/threonine-protein kinase